MSKKITSTTTNKNTKLGGSDIALAAWMGQQFDALHNDHLLILKKLEELHREHLLILSRLNAVPEMVTPELEAQVLKALKLSKSIDEKVPDMNVPPINKQ